MALFSNSYSVSFTPKVISSQTRTFYPSKHFLDKENDIWIQRQSLPIIEKYNIPMDNLLAFVNALASIVDKAAAIPDNDWEKLEYCLRHLMVRNENGRLYEAILEANPNAFSEFNFEAWCHFNMDQLWTPCLQTFTDMPTEIFERYLVDEKGWKARVGTVGEKGMKRVMEAVSQRTDMYGGNDLPSELLFFNT